MAIVSNSINSQEEQNVHDPGEGRNQAEPPDLPIEQEPFKPTGRFWLILLSISVISLAGAVEGTIVVNALPTITAELGGGNLYIWVPNTFYLASVSVVPFFAKTSDIFGRRNLLLGAVLLYVVGCALGGASISMKMLIAARVVQGMGAGGIDTLTETVILDLVPLRERGKYMSIPSVVTTLGFAAGPILGGVIVDSIGWPWIFYLMAIFGGISWIMFYFFLKVKHERGLSFWSRFKRIDFGGNAIFVGAIVSVLLALTWAGPVHEWSSFQIIVPLVLGLVGLLVFTAFEWTPRLAPEPSFPKVMVSNRTSAAALLLTVTSRIVTTGTGYFLPVYFQGVLAKSPTESGTASMPFSATIIPFCLLIGILSSKIGKYRPFHLFGCVLMLLSTGLFTTLDRHTKTSVWVILQILSAAGIGPLVVSLMPALQAPLSEREAATSAGMYNFAVSFGMVWGMTIPSTVFNNVVQRYARADIEVFGSNSTLSSMFADGQGYQLASKDFLDSLPELDPGVRDRVTTMFEEAIKAVFYSLLVPAVLSLLLVFVEAEVPMRTENKTEFGLDANETTEPVATQSSRDVELVDMSDVIRRGARDNNGEGNAIESMNE